MPAEVQGRAGGFIDVGQDSRERPGLQDIGQQRIQRIGGVDCAAPG